MLADSAPVKGPAYRLPPWSCGFAVVRNGQHHTEGMAVGMQADLGQSVRSLQQKSRMLDGSSVWVFRVLKALTKVVVEELKSGC